MCVGDRLRSLQMRIAGHNRMQVVLSQIQQDTFQFGNILDKLDAGFAGPELQVRRHLVVSAASGMKLLPGSADPVGQMLSIFI